jgi:hypothetical protein
MTEINRDNSEIVIKEVFFFDVEVLPKIDVMQANLEFEVENGDISFCIINNVKEFIDYELTKDDEFEILKLIKHSYDQDVYFNFEVSIFDEKRIYKCLNDWVVNKFKFSYEEVIFCY